MIEQIVINMLVGIISFVTGVVFASYRIKKMMEGGIDEENMAKNLESMAEEIDEDEILD